MIGYGCNEHWGNDKRRKLRMRVHDGDNDDEDFFGQTVRP